MDSLALTPALISQLALRGITIIGEPYLHDGQMMVAIDIDNDEAARCEIVTLSSLIGSDSTHFNTPSVFRPAPEVAACSSEPEGPSGYDDSLLQCIDPTNPDGSFNVDAIEIPLRQIASGDRDQAQAGLDSLNYAREQARSHGREAEFDEAVREAQARIAMERPDEAPRVEESYRQYQEGSYRVPETSTLPPSASASSGSGSSGGSSSSGSGGSGSASGATPGAVATPGVVVAGSSADGTVPVSADGIPALALHGDSDPVGVPIVLTSGDGLVVVQGAGSVDPAHNDDDAPSAVPAPVVWSPVTLNLSSGVIPEVSGRSTIPGRDGRDAEFFQGLFGSVITAREVSVPMIVQMLTSDSPEARRVQESARRGVSELLWSSRAPSGLGTGESLVPSGPMALGFRYDPERRGIEISLTPVGHVDRTISIPAEEEAASGFGSLRGSFSQSLALFRIGIDSARRPAGSMPGTMTVFVPVLPPSQYLNGGRSLAEGPVFMARAEGATDRAPVRVDRRGDSSDHQGRGGGRDGEGGERGSRGGRHDGQPDQPDDEMIALEMEPGDEASAHAA